MESGSASPAAISPDHDALDVVEEIVLRWLEDEGSEKASELREIVESAAHLVWTRLSSDPPPIDPSEGRTSKAEVLRMLDMLEGVQHELPPAHTQSRAGYTLAPKGARAGEPGVFPAFVTALGAKDLRHAFADLWAVDAFLWDKLDTATPAELARYWLESPGRRLVQDLRVIDIMPSGQRLGATDFSAERIDEAVGFERITDRDVPPPFRAHHELYLALAGSTYLHDWEPRPLPSERTQQILHALHLLETASPLGLRGAASRWLLDEAVDKPFYEVGGERRDLREDVKTRVGSALHSWLSGTPETQVPRILETLVLHHAARFIENDTSDRAIKRAWAIARWLQACLRRSPFFGGDEEVLAAHLQARLSRSLPPLPADADALHPLRFSQDEQGLNVAEVAFVAGLIVHYDQPRERQFLPTPIPIVNALREIANRPVCAAEEDADRARLAGRNALGWPKDHPLMMPVAARRLMTDLRIAWLEHVDERAQIDMLARFQADPQQFAWVAFALHREGKHLAPNARRVAASALREFITTDRVAPHVLGTFAAGILGELSDAETKSVLDIAARSEPPWGPFVVDAVVGAMGTGETNSVWTLAIEQLVRWMEDSNADDRTRLNAALFAVRRVSVSKSSSREAWLLRLARVCRERPFSAHTGLQAELRRLGLTKTHVDGSKS